MSSKRRFTEDRVAGLLGLAFDADDGHKRITRGNNFLLAGGSDETHGLMRETIIKVNEELDARGLDLADVSVERTPRSLCNDAQPCLRTSCVRLSMPRGASPSLATASSIAAVARPTSQTAISAQSPRFACKSPIIGFRTVTGWSA